MLFVLGVLVVGCGCLLCGGWLFVGGWFVLKLYGCLFVLGLFCVVVLLIRNWLGYVIVVLLVGWFVRGFVS